MKKTLAALMLLVSVCADAGLDRSNPGLPRVTMYTQNFDNNAFSAICVDCHGRNASAHLTPIDNTKYGNHFVYGGAALAATAPAAEKIDAWPVVGRLSKYGNRSNWQSVTGQTGEMICESCHNVLKNTGVYKLLATDNDTTDPSPLCGGCHGSTAGYHHPLTGEQSTVNGRTMSNADSFFVYRNPPNAAISEVTYPGDDRINCRSCHKGHRAWTTTGARILKRGYRTSNGDPVAGVGTTGLERQADVGGGRLVTDFNPLCGACHKVDQ